MRFALTFTLTHTLQLPLILVSQAQTRQLTLRAYLKWTQKQTLTMEMKTISKFKQELPAKQTSREW